MPLFDFDRLRHAMHEQQRAEAEADQDAFGEIAEHDEKERRQQITASPREARSSVANWCFSAMFQATAHSTAASAASGM